MQFSRQIRSHFYWIFGISTLWAFICSALVGLTDQEAYYWSWSRSWDWSYFEHPPLQAWCSRLLSEVFGNANWVFRLPSTIIGRVIGFYYLFKWSEDLFSPNVRFLSLNFICSSFFILAGSLITLPDAFLFPTFCALLYYGHKQSILGTSFALGLAMLSKWTAILFVPAVIIAFLFHPHRQKNLKGLIIVTLVSFAMQFPIFLWNIENQWASIKFHLHDRHPVFNWELMSLLKNFVAFMGSQIALWGIPGILFFFNSLKISFGSRSSNKSFREKLLLLSWSLPAFFVVGFSAIRGEMRFYWTAPALIPLTFIILNRLCSFMKQRTLLLTSYLSTFVSLLLLSTILFLPIGEYLRPIVESYRSYDMRFSPRGDMEGWTQLINELKSTKIIENNTQNDLYIAGSDFRLSAQLAWALQVKDVHKILVGSHTKNQYAFWDDPKNPPKQGKRALFAADNRYRSLVGFSPLCSHELDWKNFDYSMGKYVVKQIKWAICESLNP